MQKLSVCNQKLCCGILQHIHQTILRIRRIERLICGSCFNHAHRCNRHILTTRNQNGHDIFRANSVGDNVFSEPVTDLIQFLISVLLILKYHSRMIRYGLYHFSKPVRNCFRSVIFAGRIIEFCNFLNRILRENGNL